MFFFWGERWEIRKKELKKRKVNRINSVEYCKCGYYFITICVQKKENILCKVKQEKIILPQELTQEGKIVKQTLLKIPIIYSNIILDEYIIMPNHIHFILLKKDSNNHISNIINQYKGNVTKQIKYSIWQKSFHDMIIRTQSQLQQIRNYIKNNPSNWNNDIYHKK